MPRGASTTKQIVRGGVVAIGYNESFNTFAKRMRSYATAPAGLSIEGPILAFMASEHSPEIRMGQLLPSGQLSWQQAIGPILNQSEPRLIVKYNAGKERTLFDGLNTLFGGLHDDGRMSTRQRY